VREGDGVPSSRRKRPGLASGKRASLPRFLRKEPNPNATSQARHRPPRSQEEAAGRFSYRDRRRRKRDFRRLWITRISAGARAHELTYSQFIFGLKKLGVALDRKMLAEMAARDATGFSELAGKVKTALAAG